MPLQFSAQIEQLFFWLNVSDKFSAEHQNYIPPSLKKKIANMGRHDDKVEEVFKYNAMTLPSVDRYNENIYNLWQLVLRK